MNDTVITRMADGFDALPAQLRKAARWVLDNPADVALLSMREQARRAGVQPATMTRLARAFGLDGYEALRARHAEALRGRRAGLSVAAERSLATGQGAGAPAAEGLATQARALATLAADPGPLTAAAQRLIGAQRVYCLGLRSAHAVAWHLHYLLELAGHDSRLLDAPGGTGPDALRRAGPRDVLAVVAMDPYARTAVQAARLARDRGVHVLAITDSVVAPVLRPEDSALVVGAAGAGALHAMTPAFAVAETLGALVARARPEAALDALAQFDAHLDAFDTYLS